MAGDHGKIHVINSLPEYLQKVKEAHNSGKCVVIFFTKPQTTSEADACQLMSPIFNELSKKHENLIFLEVDFSNPNLKNIVTLCQVKEVPSFAFFKRSDNPNVQGEFAPPLVGADEERLKRRCMVYDPTA